MKTFNLVEHVIFETAEKRFKNVVKNTRSFNKGVITSKTTKYANGKTVSFYSKKTKKHLRDIFMVHDRFGWTTGITDFKG